MALYRYRTHETPTGFTVGPELDEQRCHYCGGESRANVCPGDGGSHYHGEVHLPGGGLVAVCGTCIPKARAEWANLNAVGRRLAQSSKEGSNE